MSTRKKQTWKDSLYFCTITCYDWLPLFEITDYYKQIYKWFDILKSKGIKITAYVIMPNHLHVILFLPNQSKTIDKVVSNWKRFMAYDIVNKLNDKKQFKILKKLESSVSEKEKQKGKKHQVFMPSFDAKVLITEKFIRQKLTYIHMNPVSKKWHLADEYISYPYSSAAFYENENYNGYMITHIEEVFED